MNARYTVRYTVDDYLDMLEAVMMLWPAEDHYGRHIPMIAASLHDWLHSICPNARQTLYESQEQR